MTASAGARSRSPGVEWQVAGPQCSAMPVGNPLPPGLSLKLVVDQRTITGDFGSAPLVVSERGPGAFQMDTGQPLVAQVVRPGTRRVIGTYDAGIERRAIARRSERVKMRRSPRSSSLHDATEVLGLQCHQGATTSWCTCTQRRR